MGQLKIRFSEQIDTPVVMLMMVMTMMMVMVMMMVANLKSDHPSICLVQCRKDIMGVGTNIG